MTAASMTASTPYTGVPQPIPGQIEAEQFDAGGEGVAYHKAVPLPNGVKPATRNTGVFTELTGDAGGGYDVGYISPGDWLQYTVFISPGAYQFNFRVACNGPGGTFHAELDGTNFTGPLQIPNTGNWQVYATLPVPAVNVSIAGPHVLRVVFESAAPGQQNVGNLNWISAVAIAGTTPPGPAVVPVPVSQPPAAVRLYNCLWDVVPIPGSIPLWCAGGDVSNPAAFAAAIPPGVLDVNFDFEPGPPLDANGDLSGYAPGQSGAAQVTAMDSFAAALLQINPAFRLSAFTMLLSNASYNLNNAGNVRWCIQQVPFCAPAFKKYRGGMSGGGGYWDVGQDEKRTFGQMFQWTGFARQLAALSASLAGEAFPRRLLFWLQADYEGSSPPAVMSENDAELMVENCAMQGNCDLIYWDPNDATLVPGFTGSPLVSVLRRVTQPDGTINLNLI